MNLFTSGTCAARPGPTPSGFTSALIGTIFRMLATDRPQKITFADMRDMGVRGLLIYCADYCCSHSLAISGDAWPDELRLSDLEPRSICVPVASVARMCGRISIGTR